MTSSDWPQSFTLCAVTHQGKISCLPWSPQASAASSSCALLGGNRDNCGASVFIGLPSQSEVRLALSAAGLPCPNLSSNGGQ